MSFVDRVLNDLGTKRWILMQHRVDFLTHLREELPPLIERFYSALGAPIQARWGDKNPHYADPKDGPDCLRTIDELFPASQFLNLVRDGRQVVASIVAKGWTDLEEAINVWSRCVSHARTFGKSVGPGRYLEVKYEDLLNRPHLTVASILRFLDLPDHPEVTEFLRQQDEQRTPFSKPTVTPEKIGQTGWSDRLETEAARRVNADLADLLAELGYVHP